MNNNPSLDPDDDELLPLGEDSFMSVYRGFVSSMVRKSSRRPQLQNLAPSSTHNIKLESHTARNNGGNFLKQQSPVFEDKLIDLDSSMESKKIGVHLRVAHEHFKHLSEAKNSLGSLRIPEMNRNLILNSVSQTQFLNRKVGNNPISKPTFLCKLAHLIPKKKSQIKLKPINSKRNDSCSEFPSRATSLGKPCIQESLFTPLLPLEKHSVMKNLQVPPLLKLKRHKAPHKKFRLPRFTTSPKRSPSHEFANEAYQISPLKLLLLSYRKFQPRTTNNSPRL